jgi:DNA end-binding protein Ku
MAKRRHARRTSSPRASWKGLLRFGLLSFQVEAINAHAPEESDIHFHQLHATCHSRIHYQKVCPIHGEVSNDEIVSGYEYGRGKYVEIEPEELDRLRTNHEKALTIDAFVPPGEIDPIYYDGRMYHLLPAGPADREAYALLQAAMLRQDRWGIGQVVFSGKDQLVLARPRGDLLVMSMLNYSAEIRSPEDIEGTQRAAKSTPRKLKLAEDLVKVSAARHVGLARYEDRYRERVEELIKETPGH